LGILLIDFLAGPKCEGYADEVVIAADLRLSQKNVRKALRYLESEHLVSSETVKISLRRRNAELQDDPEVEERKRQETHVFWCLDYPRMLDALRLRLQRIRQILRHQTEDVDAVLMYRCPQCGATFSSLHAATLLDPAAGVFRCEECRGELIEHTEGPGGAAAGPGAAASRRERQAFFKGLQGRFEAVVKPLVEQMERIKDVSPPDFGDLKDWMQVIKEERELKAKRLAQTRKNLLAGGMAAENMTEEQLMEWADKAEVIVALPGMARSGEGDGTDAVQVKELPVWFRGNDGPSGSVGGGGVDSQEQLQQERFAAASQAENSEEQRKILEKQYLEQYLQQVKARTAMAASLGAGSMGVSDGAKRVKIEGEVKEEEVKMEVEEEGVKGEEIEWEDASGAGPGAATLEDEVDWEDA